MLLILFRPQCVNDPGAWPGKMGQYISADAVAPCIAKSSPGMLLTIPVFFLFCHVSEV